MEYLATFTIFHYVKQYMSHKQQDMVEQAINQDCRSNLMWASHLELLNSFKDAQKLVQLEIQIPYGKRNFHKMPKTAKYQRS